MQEHLDELLPRAPQPTRGGFAATDGRIIGPPVVLDRRLDVGLGLRLLLHADPTFTAMNTLKRQVELILGTPISSRALSSTGCACRYWRMRDWQARATTSWPAICRGSAILR
ncbi:MAG: hypothetical protein R3F55_01465 [Alphaproteobacteria bacterium]